MKKLALLLLLALCACTTKADYIKDAKWWQGAITYEVVEAVELSEGIEVFKAQVDKPGFVWTDEFVGEVLNYIDDLTHYQPISHEGGRVKTPAGMSYTGYWGNCYDISTYTWCILKYLDYPYNARMQGVRFAGMNHAMIVIEMPSDKRWIRYQTASFLGTQKFDEIFYRTQIEWDTQGIWLPGDLQRPDSWTDHWSYMVTEY